MEIFKNRILASVCAFFLLGYIIMLFCPLNVKIAVIAISVFAAVVIIVCKRRFVFESALLLSLCAATILSVFYFNLNADNIKAVSGQRAEALIEITSVSYQSDSIAYFNGKVDNHADLPNGFKCHFTVNEPKLSFSPGDVIISEVEYKELSNDENGFNEEIYYNSNGIFISAIINNDSEISLVSHKDNKFNLFLDSVRDYVRSSYSKYMGKDVSALLCALTIGDRSSLTDDIKRDFSRIGISHMLAISGLHLSIIMGFIIGIFDLLSINKKVSSIVVVSFCLFYIFISGASGSVIRSSIMFIIVAFSLFAKRKGDSLTALFMAIVLIIIFSPCSIYDIGLILSFTSTFGIIVIAPPILKLIKDPYRYSSRVIKIIEYILASFIITFSAIAFSIIPMSLFFDSISLISPVSNLILSPFITLIMFSVPVFIILSPISYITSFSGIFLTVLCRMFLTIVRFIASFKGIVVSLNYPFMPVVISAFVVGLIICVALRKRYLLICPLVCFSVCFCVCLGVYQSNYKNFSEMVCLSKKSNDSILIRSGEGTAFIDFSNESKSFGKTVFDSFDSELYAPEIDIWVVTHYSNKTVSISKYLFSAEYISEIYLPVPENELQVAAFREISDVADRANVKVEKYEYQNAINILGFDFMIDAPVALKNTNILLFKSEFDIHGRRIGYFSKGYFDNSEVDSSEYDILFVGSNGTRREQKISPVLHCNTLIYDVSNLVAVDDIVSENTVVLSDNYNVAKFRIE